MTRLKIRCTRKNVLFHQSTDTFSYTYDLRNSEILSTSLILTDWISIPRLVAKCDKIFFLRSPSLGRRWLRSTEESSRLCEIGSTTWIEGVIKKILIKSECIRVKINWSKYILLIRSPVILRPVDFMLLLDERTLCLFPNQEYFDDAVNLGQL